MANLPTATQHEKALIGAMLQDPDCRKKALSIVSPEHFTSERHKAIIRSFGVIKKGDYLELIDDLKKSGFISGNGGAEEMGVYLTGIINNTATATGSAQYVKKIREAAFRRDLMATSEALKKDAINYKLNVGDILDAEIQKLNDIREKEKAVFEGQPERKGLDDCAIDFAQLVSMEIAERARFFSWLLEGGLIMVYGPRGLGKTFFVSSLAASLVTGSPFMKWGQPMKPSGVLIVDGEMALADLRERLNSLLTTLPVMPLKVISSEVVFSETERDINLVTETQRKDIINLLDQNKAIKVVIIDNISCLFSGLRESSKTIGNRSRLGF